MSQAHYRCGSHRNSYVNGAPAHCDGAVVRWVCQNDNVITLCKLSFDFWLGFADDDPDLEPKSFTWLWDAGVRFCAIHRWPADLCSDWTHNRRTLEGLGLRPVDLAVRGLISRRDLT